MNSSKVQPSDARLVFVGFPSFALRRRAPTREGDETRTESVQAGRRLDEKTPKGTENLLEWGSTGVQPREAANRMNCRPQGVSAEHKDKLDMPRC